MHMRKKKWARPELACCAYYSDHAETFAGHWKEIFDNDYPLHVELGCGKGVSTAQMVRDNPDVNYIVMDISPDVLGDTRRNIENALIGTSIRNVLILRCDISEISHFTSPEDKTSRIYINFCNPWPRPKHHKRRLTHPRQLIQYRTLLEENGEIYFKTDDDDLFEDSLRYFSQAGFETIFLTRDLHASGFQPNYESEHEKKFTALGIPIKFGIFRKQPAEQLSADTFLRVK